MSEQTITTQEADSPNEKVDTLFSEWDQPHTPGCAIAIIQNGEIVYSRGYGMANLDYDIPISIDSVFDIASTSKQFVALSVAILARQGKLSLHDDIQTYLPELPFNEKPISIYHLIYHTSGLRDYLTLMHLAGMPFEHNYSKQIVLDILARQKHLNFQPGEKFLYSNTGYLLLAEIAKRVSGMSLRAFADKHIFEPLGMKDTHFHDNFSDVVKNRVVGYSPVSDGGFRVNTSLFDLVGDGGLYTTVRDLCKWEVNAYQNKIGGYGPNLITEITTPGHLNNGIPLDYAYGLFVRPYRGLNMVHHSGVWMGYKAEMARFPDQRFSVICLSNLSSVNPLQLVKQISGLYLVGEFTENKQDTRFNLQPDSAKPPLNLESKAGLYRSIKGDEIWEFSVQHGKLVADNYGLTFELSPIDHKQFAIVRAATDMIIKFNLQKPQNLSTIQVVRTNGETVMLESIQPDIPNPKNALDYSGEYYCEELDVGYTIDLVDGELLLSRGCFQQDRLAVISRDLCKGIGGYFSFTRTVQNQVTGFKLDTARVKNLYFRKS
jgi:CubicO group peptidase (beta-lactamase class C family)